jgi:hypothetical protein
MRQAYYNAPPGTWADEPISFDEQPSKVGSFSSSGGGVGIREILDDENNAKNFRLIMLAFLIYNII